MSAHLLQSEKSKMKRFDVHLIGLPPRWRENEDGAGMARSPSQTRLFQLLPELVPEARLFEYPIFGLGQSSDSRCLLPGSISAEACCLLDTIKSRLVDEQRERSILLLGYGLGGVIIKQALILANSHPGYYDVATRTSDVVFISTPHSGPNSDDWEKVLIRLISFNQIEFHGRKGSAVSALALSIESVTSQFYCIASRYNVTNFYDELAIEICIELLPDSLSVNPTAKKIFALTDDSPAIALGVGEWESALRNTLAPLHLLNDSLDSGAHITTDYLDCLQLFCSSRWFIHETTSNLLVEDSAILDMWHGQIESLLPDRIDSKCLSVHITGPPDHGKSTLKKFLAHETRKRLMKVIILDLMEDTLSGPEATPHKILLSLAHQLLSQVPTLFQHVRGFYIDHAQEKIWNVETLETFVSVLFRHCNAWKVVLVRSDVENWLSDSRKLVEKLLDFFSSIGLDFMHISSSDRRKDCDNLSQVSPSSASHEARTLDLWPQIEKVRTEYMEAKLDALANHPEHWAITAFKQDISKQLKHFNGSYVTFDLYTMQLSHKLSLSNTEVLRSCLDKWPGTEIEVYELGILDIGKEQSHVFDWCRMALSWVLHAQRPLRIQELAAAVAIKERHFDIKAMDSAISCCMHQDLKRHLGIWVRLEGQVVHLSTSTTRRFLHDLFNSPPDPQQPRETGHQVLNTLTHADLARQCLKYLTQLLTNLEELQIQWRDCRAQVAWRYANRQETHSILAFLSYATTQWPRHYRLAGDDHLLDSSVMKLFENEELVRKWYELYCLGTSLRLSPIAGAIPILEIATELGFFNIVKANVISRQFLKDNPLDLNTLLVCAIRGGHDDLIKLLLKEKASGTDALLEACRNGNAETVQALLQQPSYDGDLESSPRATALHLAAQRGNLEAFDILLKHFSITTADIRGRTPLHQAVLGGNIRLIELLLGSGTCDLDAQDHDSQTPLLLAAKLGLVSVVRSLASMHADVNVPCKNGQTALHLSTNDSLEMVNILLEFGADPTAIDEKGESALFSACVLGHLEIATRLLDALNDNKNSIIGCPNVEDKTALEVAAAAGHYTVVQLLLAVYQTSTMEAKTNEAIELAAQSGHLAIVKHLVEHSKAGMLSSFQKALSNASSYGHILVVDFLLDENVRNSEDDNSSALAAASKNGHLSVVRALLKHKADPNVETEDEFTPLHLAVREGRIEIAAVLLNEGADVNALGSRRLTPLHIAASKGHTEIVELLLGHGAMPNARTRERDSVLHQAVAHMDLVELLLKAKVDLNPLNSHGVTPLQVAIKKGYEDTANLLLDRGAALDTFDEDGYTPLHDAIRTGSVAMIKRLWKSGFDPENEAYKRQPPIMVAASTQNLEVLEFLMDQDPAFLEDTNAEGMTALHVAAENGCPEATEFLLDRSSNPDLIVNKQDDHGRTPLYLSSSNSDSSIVSMLLLAGASAEKEAKDRTLPLHRAASAGRLESVTILLKAMTDAPVLINKRDKYGRTPLFRAAWLGHLHVIEKLAESGASLQIPDDDGWTPLHAAADDRDITDYLIQKGADLDSPDFTGQTPLMRAVHWGGIEPAMLLLKSGAQVNIETQDGTTPLHIAIKRSKPSFVDLLITWRADVYKINTDGQTALHIAAAEADDGNSMTESLLDATRPLIDAKDKNGRSALHLACIHKNLVALEKLLRQNPDIEAVDTDGRTALHHAIMQSNRAMMDQLLQHGASIESRDTSGQSCLHFAVESASGTVLNAIMDQEAKGSSEVWLEQDRISALWTAYDSGNTSILMSLLHWEREKKGSKLVVNSRSAEGLTLLEAALLDGRNSMVLTLLDHGLDPFQRLGTKRCAFEMVPMYDHWRGHEAKDVFRRCLDKLPNDLTILGDGFGSLRAALEVGCDVAWTKLEPLLKYASTGQDEDGWKLHHYIHQSGSSLETVQPGKVTPEPIAVRPNYLKLLRPHGQQERGKSDFEIIEDFQFEYKLSERIPITVRAGLPLPPRDTGPAYFEVEVLEREDCDDGTLIGIGLCSEFNDLRDCWPGIQYNSVGYHSDGDIVEKNTAVKKLANYVKGDTIGCGLDWKTGAYFFTLNGKLVVIESSQVINRKLYPVITMSDSPGTLRVNFGGAKFMYNGVLRQL